MIHDMLQIAVLLLRAFLAIILLAAGAAKLADMRNFSTTLIGLGIPAWRPLLIRGIALSVPLVEVVLGMAIVSNLWPTIVDSAVLVLMSSFSIVVIVALRKKLQVTCRCFGALSDSQFSSKGLLRSVGLTAAALAVMWGDRAVSLQQNASPGMIALLIVGFLLFALASMQAARTLAVLKRRAIS